MSEIKEQLPNDRDETCLLLRRGMISVLLAVLLLGVVGIRQEFEVVPLNDPYGSIMAGKYNEMEAGKFSTLLPISDSDTMDTPEVVWLMTFPNSGTTYTLKLIQQYTNTTTGTNYGNEQGVHGTTTLMSNEERYINGPFYRYATWNRPADFILTKTHCGGTSISPSPNDYVETARSFEVACRSGNRVVNGVQEPTTYDMDIVSRVVHLIRNPFDNIVARLHMEQKHWERNEETAHLVDLFNSTKEGFQAWCKDLDEKALSKESKSRYFDEELFSLAREVPCHGEFIRYVWWHNHAINLAQRKDLRALTFHYEDYESNWEQTVSNLFVFLKVSPAAGAKPETFVRGKSYGDLFETYQVDAARKLMETLASPDTWSLIKSYFE